MDLFDIGALLRENSYPGRGIVIGRSADGENAVIAYFIMGRSENSRNRVFKKTGDGIITEAFDPSKMSDPSLIIYAPVRRAGDVTVVTNGDQTDTICEYLLRGGSFEEALRTRTFEPDAPNFTPRISGMVTPEADGFSYRLSILKSCRGNPASVERFFWEYAQPLPGEGRFIHTYRCDGSPIPSFEGEPEPVALAGGIDAFAAQLWENLNQDNKVSLFVRYIRLSDGREETRIFKKNG